MTEGTRPQKQTPEAVGTVATVILLQAIMGAIKKHHPDTYATVLANVELARNHELGRLTGESMNLVDLITMKNEVGPDGTAK